MIATDLVGGSSPDRFGGARVALFSLIVERMGLVVIGTAANGTVAILGAILTGCGSALVFPSFGLEAVKRAPPASRGFAMGGYNAYLDLTLGIAAPAMVVLASATSLIAVFLVAAAAAAPIATMLRGSGQA